MKNETNELLSVEEIEDRFESEWILVGDTELDSHFRVIRGKVIWHSKDRDEVYREAVRLRPKRFAMLYTGTLPRDTAIVV